MRLAIKDKMGKIKAITERLLLLKDKQSEPVMGARLSEIFVDVYLGRD